MPCKIYLYLRRNDKMICLASHSFEISREFLNKYIDRGLAEIWIANEDWDAFKAFIRESGDTDAVSDTQHDEVEAELAEREKRETRSAPETDENSKKTKLKSAEASSTDETAPSQDDDGSASDEPNENGSASPKKKKNKRDLSEPEDSEDETQSEQHDESENEAEEEAANAENDANGDEAGSDEAPAAKKKKRYEAGTEAGTEDEAVDEDETDDETPAADKKREKKKKKKSRDVGTDADSDGESGAEADADEAEEISAEENDSEETADAPDGEDAEKAGRTKKKKRFAVGTEAGADEGADDDDETDDEVAEADGSSKRKKRKLRAVGIDAEDPDSGSEAEEPIDPELEQAEEIAAARKREREEAALSPEERKKRAQQTLSDVFQSKDGEIEESTKRDLNRTIERALQSVFNKNANSFQAIFEVSEFLPDGSHGLHVCHYASMIAMALGITEDAELAPLMSAALLHDIGHTQIAIKKTTVVAADSPEKPNTPQCEPEPEIHISESTSLIEKLLGDEGKAVAEIVAAHHEKFDGTGFPRKLKGEAISKFAQILAIADRIDQMVSGQWDTVKRSLNEVAASFDFQYVRAKKVTDFDPALMKEIVSFMRENADALNEVADEKSGETAEKLMGQGHDSLKTRTKAA